MGKSSFDDKNRRSIQRNSAIKCIDVSLSVTRQVHRVRRVAFKQSLFECVIQPAAVSAVALIVRSSALADFALIARYFWTSFAFRRRCRGDRAAARFSGPRRGKTQTQPLRHHVRKRHIRVRVSPVAFKRHRKKVVSPNSGARRGRVAIKGREAEISHRRESSSPLAPPTLVSTTFPANSTVT